MFKLNFTFIIFLVFSFLISVFLESQAGSYQRQSVSGQWESRDGFITSRNKNTRKEQGAVAPCDFSIRGDRELDHLFKFEEGAWDGWREIEWTFKMPPDLPEGGKIYFFTKDRDFLWRQISLPLKAYTDNKTSVFRLPLQGEEAEKRWRPVGHNRPWHTLTSQHIIEAGFRIVLPEGKDAYKGVVRLQKLEFVGTINHNQSKPKISSFRMTPRAPRIGEMVQVRIDLEASYSNPFDRNDIAVDAEFIRPDGKRELVKGFYYEGFLSDSVVTGKEELIPYGEPEFRIRYTPRIKGKHKLRISITAEGGKTEVPSFAFTVRKATADYRGFIRVDPEHPLHLEDDRGDVFDGIGLNFKTPADPRYNAMNPASRWEDEGLDTYRWFLPELSQAGVNIMEVWMSSWWLALEWINDDLGYHGVGYFNPWRAWKLDQLVKMAEENDIYIILVLNNHGKFSNFCDQEWHRNPYNVQQGGFLASPESYFTDKKAKDSFERLADYIVARWGHSPNIITWKLFSEINLMGNSNGFYRRPPMQQWHREMSEYIKEIDPYNHMITTHWSSNYTQINYSIARLPKLDILTGDAYNSRTVNVLNFFEGTMKYAKRIKKPTIITEYGGPPLGTDFGTLQKQLHLGLWKEYFLNSAILPMLWWFALIEDKDWYHEYAAIAAFREGEDRRELEPFSLFFPKYQTKVKLLSNTSRMLVWGYDSQYYLSGNENGKPRLIEGLTVPVTNLAPGDYQVELWSGEKADSGGVIINDAFKVTGDKADNKLEIPPFKRDFSLKIVPAQGG